MSGIVTEENFEVRSMSATSSEISLLLDQYRDGQTEALGKLMELVYDDLRRLAAWQLQADRFDHSLQPTALVHEAYLKLAGQNRVEWQNKAHFFALASQSHAPHPGGSCAYQTA